MVGLQVSAHVQVQSDLSYTLEEALAPGQLVFASRRLDVQSDAEQGVDIASVLPRRMMEAGIDIPQHSLGVVPDVAPICRPTSGLRISSAPWGKEGDDCVICLGEMVAGEEVSDPWTLNPEP